jgi:hypothetical protein
MRLEPPADTRWRRSTYCVGQSHCVEIADLGDQIGLRNSQIPTVSLAFDRSTWRNFVESVKAGEFRPRDHF